MAPLLGYVKGVLKIYLQWVLTPYLVVCHSLYMAIQTEKRTTISLTKDDLKKIESIKKQYGINSLASAVRFAVNITINLRN